MTILHGLTNGLPPSRRIPGSHHGTLQLLLSRRSPERFTAALRPNFRLQTHSAGMTCGIPAYLPQPRTRRSSAAPRSLTARRQRVQNALSQALARCSGFSVSTLRHTTPGVFLVDFQLTQNAPKLPSAVQRLFLHVNPLRRKIANTRLERYLTEQF